MLGGKYRWGILSGAALLVAGGAWLGSLQAEPPKEKAPKAEAPAKSVDPAVARTRKTVQMLDTIYKSAIVLITDNYVTEDSDLPAGAAFKALFKSMKDGGYHEVRLIDATGEPYDEANSPRDEFEKDAIAQLKAGKPYVEKIEEKDGKRFLRAATPIPVVLEKCALCHPHYSDAKPGAAIGALGYTIPIE
jgi:hypothetical protein